MTPIIPATLQAQSMFAYELLKALQVSGALSKEQCLAILTETANRMRDGSEDEPNADAGETVARIYEATAALLARASRS